MTAQENETLESVIFQYPNGIYCGTSDVGTTITITNAKYKWIFKINNNEAKFISKIENE